MLVLLCLLDDFLRFCCMRSEGMPNASILCLFGRGQPCHQFIVLYCRAFTPPPPPPPPPVRQLLLFFISLIMHARSSFFFSPSCSDSDYQTGFEKRLEADRKGPLSFLSAKAHMIIAASCKRTFSSLSTATLHARGLAARTHHRPIRLAIPRVFPTIDPPSAPHK